MKMRANVKKKQKGKLVRIRNGECGENETGIWAAEPRICDARSKVMWCKKQGDVVKNIEQNDVRTNVRTVSDNCQKHFRQLSETFVTNVSTSLD